MKYLLNTYYVYWGHNSEEDRNSCCPYRTLNKGERQEAGCVQIIVSDMRKMTRMMWRATILDKAVRDCLSKELMLKLRLK